MIGSTDSPRATTLFEIEIENVTPPPPACVRAAGDRHHPDALSAAHTLEATALELTFIAGPPLALGLATRLSTRVSLLAGVIILLAATRRFRSNVLLDGEGEDLSANQASCASVTRPKLELMAVSKARQSDPTPDSA